MMINNNNDVYGWLRESGLLKNQMRKKYPKLEYSFELAEDTKKYNL